MDAFVVPILAGFLIGFLIGLTGMGGGALMTPFLILWLELDTILAVGTDLMFAAITKIFGGVQHWRADHVALRSVLWLAAGSVPATFVAGRFVLYQTRESAFLVALLPTLLGAVLVLVALLMLARLIGILPVRQETEVRQPAPVALIAIGALGGLLVGLTSVGGGTVILALLLLVYTLPLPQLVGIDVVHGALLTSAAALTYAGGGQTLWSTVALLLIGSLPGVALGAGAVDRVNVRVVRTGVALLILLAGIELLRG